MTSIEWFVHPLFLIELGLLLLLFVGALFLPCNGPDLKGQQI